MFFNDTATTDIYTLSLHDALPIYHHRHADDHADADDHTDADRDADADHDGLPPQPLVFYRGTIGGFAAEG